MFRLHRRLVVVFTIALIFVFTITKYKKREFYVNNLDGLNLTPPFSNQTHQENQVYKPVPQENPSNISNSKPEEKQEEKFLTYLPHSGFHNQRIALENAILLARYLNRTLLVPPVYLGDAQSWKPFDDLSAALEKRTKLGMAACSKYSGLPPTKGPKKCALYSGWTMLPWSSIYSLDSLQGFVRLRERDSMSISSLEQYGININQDIHFIKDTSLYDYRIFDYFPPGYIVGKYEQKIMVSELQEISDKLLHIGSIFGNLRVTTLLRGNAKEYKYILDKLQFTNPTLIRGSQSIVNQLGGMGNYLGIHLRVGDGAFSYKVEENARGILELMARMLPVVNGEGNEDQYEEKHPTLSGCLNRNPITVAKSPLVYLATDARNPRERTDFSPIFDRFPCTFILSDFIDSSASIHEENPWDGTSIHKYLVPMIDAITVAKGEFYVGTNQSTFSMFVRRMHNHYLGRPDPLKLKY
ncbi:hypothetical protein K7432_003902 [Basidiobolus ranarum]|uniref:O-fucosyltransferase family protein n=1 Tax=Basidiobolus ranarum TaxID=34480 RepID=A0ABR2W5J5_9FUNG